MRLCPQCQTENRARATFCRACGAPLVLICPQCRRTLPLGTQFCDACGTRLVVTPAVPTAPAEASALVEAIQRHVPREFAERLRATRGRIAQERRMVSILFSDIKGYSTIAGALDPEEVIDIVNGAFEFLIGPVYRHEGTLAQLMGDAILAFFGAPIAHEDDPERAISAALEIQQGARDYAARLQRERGIKGFAVRVGINTGQVVVGEVGSDLRVTYTAVGDAINMAARMEQNAPGGGILITHDTYRLVRGAFDVQAMPPLAVKGRQEPLQTYLVLRAKPRRFRMPERGVEGVATRMIGREIELRRLQDALMASMQESEGQVITIVGEAGVGKSRLVDEFQNWIEPLPEQVRLFRARGHPEAQSQPYALLRDLFAFRFQIQDNDTLEVVRHKLEAGFAEAFGAAEPAHAHVIGQLLGFDFSASPHLQGLMADPEALRNRGLADLAAYFQAASAQGPAVLLLEDIHWVDDASLDAVNQLGRTAAHAPLLIVCLTRPVLFERRPYWGEGQIYHSRLDLHPLSRQHSRQLVAEILRRVSGVPPALRDLVVEGAEGNPFYIEELIKMLIERGVIIAGEQTWSVQADRLAALDVPSSLTEVLQARLDALPLPEKGVLQEASVVGRVFWDMVVQHVHQAAEQVAGTTDVVAALGALREREMVFRREESAFTGAQEYVFKHAILRDVTYESVLKRLRRAYHGAAADWLIAHCGDRTAEYSGLIAQHLEGAEQGARAVGYLHQAARAALARQANTEAEGYLRRALGHGPSPEEHADLLSELGEALRTQGRFRDAIETWRAGIDLYHARADLDGVARLYARSARAWWASDPPRGLALCREGLAATAAASPSVDQARLLHEAARACYFNGLAGEAEALCRQALDIAQQLATVEVEADALATVGIMDRLPAEERRAALERAAALAEEHGLLDIAYRAHNNLGYAIFGVEGIRLGDAIPHHLRMAAIARQRGSVLDLGQALGSESEVWALVGDLRAAEERCVAMNRLGPELPQPDIALVMVREVNAWLLLLQGDWGRALDMCMATWPEVLRRGDRQQMLAFAWMLCFACWQLHRFGQAPAWQPLEPVLGAIATVDWNDWKASKAFSGLSLVRSCQGRYAEAAQRLQQAQGMVRCPTDAIITFCAAGELATCEQRWDDAMRAWSSLLETAASYGSGWFEAAGLLYQAKTYLARGEGDDRARALALYRQARERFAAMPAPGYVRAIDARSG